MFQRLLLFSLLVVISSGCNNPAKPPDLILINGKVITLDADSTVAGAIALNGSIIQAVGKDEEIKALAGDSTRVIDLKGKCIIPGLIDAHTHLDIAALSELDQEIPEVSTVADVVEYVEGKAKALPDGNWIAIPKLFSTRLKELRWPSLAELDEVSPNHPVFLDGSYAAMVNTYALEISGITTNTRHAGVLIDELTSELNGIILRSAFHLLHERPEPVPSHAQRVEAIIAMMKRYNQVGITSALIRSSKPADFLFFQDIADQGRSTIRTNLTFHQRNLGIDNTDSIEEVREKITSLGINSGSGNEWVRAGALKWQIDGGILTGTAYLREPWAQYYPERVKEVYGIRDQEYQGMPIITRDKLASFIALAEELGWDFTAHCTGGAGVDLMLAAYDQFRETTPEATQGFSIIHGNFYTPESIQIMKKLKVSADMQPAWFYKDADAMAYLLGDVRMKTFHPYKSLFEAGVMVNGGSDHMVKFDSYTSVNPFNPFLAMWSVITRQTEQGSTIVPEEAVTREEALSMYTINNAILTNEEDLKGTLEPGKLADLVVISKDILNCPVDDIRDMKVELTVVGGTVVYPKIL